MSTQVTIDVPDEMKEQLQKVLQEFAPEVQVKDPIAFMQYVLQQTVNNIGHILEDNWFASGGNSLGDCMPDEDIDRLFDPVPE